MFLLRQRHSYSKCRAKQPHQRKQCCSFSFECFNLNALTTCVIILTKGFYFYLFVTLGYTTSINNMYPFNINPTNKPALTQPSIKPATIPPTCINPKLQPDSMHHSKTRWTAVDSFGSYSAQLQNTVDVALVLFHLIPEKACLFLVSRVDVLGPPPLHLVYSTASCLVKFCVHLKTTSST